MSTTKVISTICLILGVILLENFVQSRRISQPVPRRKYSDESDSGESYEDFEMGNPNDRGIGFGKNKNASAGSKYPFSVTAEPTYTQQPEMFNRLKAKGYNDIEDLDKDYYAHYDFEFAKSGIVHANFQQKYLNHQTKHIGKPIVNPNAPPPHAAPADDAFGKGIIPAAATANGKSSRSLTSGLLGL